MTKHSPDSRNEVIEWEFIGRSIYSANHANPKRKMEHSYREVNYYITNNFWNTKLNIFSHQFQGLEDVIREIMQHINNFSRQRGRVIEFRELLYGYSRLNTIYGHDLILDLLLVYKKYRGKKMTVPGK